MQNQNQQYGHQGIHTPAQVERFGLISEELGEGTQAVGKIIRHGFGAVDPVGNYHDNKTQLEKELGDVLAASLLSACAGELSFANIVGHAVNKARKIVDGEAFLHYQPQALLEKMAVAAGDLVDLHTGLVQDAMRRDAEAAVGLCKAFGIGPTEAMQAARDPQRRRIMLISLGSRVPTPAELDAIVERFQNAEIDPLGPVTGRTSSDPAKAAAQQEQATQDTIKQATIGEITAVVKSCIEDGDFMFPVRSGTKRFQKLIDMLKQEYGQHIVFDFPKRRDFHRAIDLQNWAVQCLVQNSLDMGTAA